MPFSSVTLNRALPTRPQATLSVTDSHEDFFVRNIVAFLAEMRAAFGLIRPQAFINVELA